MHKRLIALCFFVLICFCGFNVCAENDVFYIGRESDFLMLEEYPTATFYLKCSIVFTENFNTLFSEEDNPFRGTLDGKGHKLSFLKIETDEQIAALIGYNEGKLLNLNIEKSKIICSNESAVVGGLVAYNNGIIENCSFNGEIIVNGIKREDINISAENNGQVIGNVFEIDTNYEEDNSSETSSSFTSSLEEVSNSSSTLEMTHSDITNIISSSKDMESSHVKETSSKINSEKESSSSKEINSSDRIDSTEYSDSSDFTEDSGQNGNVLSLILLGVCAGAVLFACGFVVYKEILYKLKKAS